MNKTVKRILNIFAGVILISLLIYCWKYLPVLTGYGAKTMCSGIFVSGRNAADIKQNELGSFPFNIASYDINFKDSSVTAAVYGMAGKKAIYRKGLGSTLINGIKEDVLRARAIHITGSDSINQSIMAWPDGDRLPDTLPAGLNLTQLNHALSEAFEEPAHQPERRTRAIIILYNGQLIAEKYAPGYNKETKQLGWSMTKSVTNALLGLLVKDGKLNVASPAPVPVWQNDERKNITITNLMQMNTGLRFWWFPAGPSDLTNMLFREQNMGAFAMNAPLIHKPGEVFNYSDGAANILSSIIRKAVGDKDYYMFPYKALFYKLGMYHTTLEADAGGTFVGSSYCYASPRDWARLGLLFMNDGVWHGERLLPEGWLKFSTTASLAENSSKGGKYGALMWINAGDPGNPTKRKYPDVPSDCFSFQGYEGQYVWIIPSKKLVIVRLAYETGSNLEPDHFLPEVIRSLPQ